MQHFGSLHAVLEATADQLCEVEVDGVGLYGQQVETTQEIVKHQEV